MFKRFAYQLSRMFRWFVGHRRPARWPGAPVGARVQTAAYSARMHSYGYARIYNRKKW